MEISPLLVEHEAAHLLRDEEEALKRQQVSMEEYLQSVGRSEEQHLEEARAAAMQRLTRSYALLNVAETDKPKGAGGSFGYGKAGLVKAAGSKMVFAYSCFKEVEDDGGVTRRALGVSYWPSSEGHVNETGRKYDGWGQLGAPVPQGIYPIVDDEADRLAEQLGIPTRSLAGTGFAGTGTAFVLVDPVISPQDLQRAAERNWWPALEDDETQLLNYMFPHVDGTVLSNVAKIAALTRTESSSDTARINCGISTRCTVELCGLLYDGFSLEEAAEVSIYPQYDSSGGVDSERTFVKQIVQKFCDDGSTDDLFNEDEVEAATAS